MAGEKKPVILCVDDSPENLGVMHEYLKEAFDVKLVNSGQKALKLLSKQSVDLVLLDVMMPEMDGYETCRQIRALPDLSYLPILFITAKDSPEDEQMALQVGGNDFITKPINPDVLLIRIETHLKVRSYHELLKRENLRLEEELQSRLSDIFKLQEASLSVMISLAEFRDECTGNHIKRTQKYVTELARAAEIEMPHLGLNARRIELIVRCAPLHDIGKITTPDHILLKPGKLTDEEFAVMQQHAQKGFDILEAAAKNMGYYGEFLHKAQEIALTHHEKWDGSGYPRGLKGEEIPLSGRLMAIADVYDALRSSRPYKKAFSHEKAMEIMSEMAGSHLDPHLFALFDSLDSTIVDISQRYLD